MASLPTGRYLVPLSQCRIQHPPLHPHCPAGEPPQQVLALQQMILSMTTLTDWKTCRWGLAVVSTCVWDWILICWVWWVNVLGTEVSLAVQYAAILGNFAKCEFAEITMIKGALSHCPVFLHHVALSCLPTPGLGQCEAAGWAFAYATWSSCSTFSCVQKQSISNNLCKLHDHSSNMS